jgi:hypothetical protein
MMKLKLVGYTRENGGEKNKQRMLCWLEKFAKCSGKMVSGHFSIGIFFLIEYKRSQWDRGFSVLTKFP